MNTMQVTTIVSLAACTTTPVSHSILPRPASRPASIGGRLQALALRALAGDQGAWQALWKEVLDSSLILGWARRRFTSRADAEDAASEALIRAIKGFPTYEPRLSRFVTWVYTVAHNAFNGYYRRQAKHHDDMDSLEEQSMDTPADWTPLDGEEDSLQYLWALLCAPAARLSARQCQVVWLVAVEGLQHEEAALIVGITEGYCRQEYSRAKKKLREAFPDAARIAYWRGEDLRPWADAGTKPTNRAPRDAELALC